MFSNLSGQRPVTLVSTKTDSPRHESIDEPTALELYATVLRHNAVDTDASDVLKSPSPRSGLLARLKHNQQALVFPPPSRFYKPAYDLIETNGVHSVVNVDVGYSPSTIFVDQCEYTLLEANAAAKQLIEITRAEILKCKCEGGCKRMLSAACPPIWHDVLEAYGEEPEFIVQHNQWPAFKITVGRTTRMVAFDRVAAGLTQGFSLAKDASPLNLPAFLLNPSVRGVARSDTLEQKANEFRQLQEASQCSDSFRRSVAKAQLTLTPTEDAYLKPYRDDPRLLDWLKVECDSWQISKDHADWHNFPIYLDPDSSLI